MKTPRITQLSLLALSLGAVQLQGAPVYWTGDDATNPTYMGDADNWTPAGLGHLGYGVFSDGSNGKTVQVVQAGGTDLLRSVSGLNFANAGWLVTDTLPSAGGSVLTYAFNGTPAVIDPEPYGINSSGAGVNEIAVDFVIGSTNVKDTGQPDRPFTIGTGNTLYFSGSFAQASSFTLQGAGTMVVNNANSNQDNSFSAGFAVTETATLLNRGNMKISGLSGLSLTGGTLGGDGIYYVRTGTDMIFNGTTLAPGGDGSTEGGAEIGTLNFGTGTGIASADIVISSATTTVIQMGNGGGTDHDKVELDLVGGFLTIDPGATLNIVGSLIQDGAYTIFEDVGTSGDFAGTFTNLNFNGVAANPANFTVDYNADSIVVNVTGLIPEPSTYALIFGSLLGMIVMIKRRR